MRGRSHTQMFRMAEKRGWKRWGNFTKKNGSSYQCFRKGNNYIWIGYWYIENLKYWLALPYMDKRTTKQQIEKYLI